MNPRLSVIIPVYNGARTLRRAIDSVLAQGDVLSLEVIVVDDGSKDDSAQIAASYAEAYAASHPVRVIRQANAGPGAARNRGIAEARGELLAFNDSDDEWLPGRLAAQLKLLDGDPELLFVLCSFENVPDEGFEMPAWAMRENKSPDGTPAFIFQAMLARRRAFEVLGTIDESMKWAEDTDWFLRGHDMGIKATTTEMVGIRRYVHDANLTGQVTNSHRGLIKALHASLVRRRKMGLPT